MVPTRSTTNHHESRYIKVDQGGSRWINNKIERDGTRSARGKVAGLAGLPGVGVLFIPVDPKEFTGVRILGLVQKANTTNVLAKCTRYQKTLGSLGKPGESLGNQISET